MALTIEQRWKDVGVEREEVAKTIGNVGTNWHNLPGDERREFIYKADALLPLIEKAVREARKDELDLLECVEIHHLSYLWDTHIPKRRAKLEAGND